MAGKKQLGQILLEAGAIDEFQLKSALGYQKQWGGRLGKVLVENRFITEDALVDAIHKQTGIEVVHLNKLNIPDYVIKLVPVELAERNSMIPIRLEGETGKPGEHIVLAMADPTNLNVMDEVQFRTGKRTKGLLATESTISKAIRLYYHGETSEEPPEVQMDPNKIQFSGKDIAVDNMVVVQGKLEALPGDSRPSAVPEPKAPEPKAQAPQVGLEDPFAELDSLANEPQPPLPPLPPIQATPAEEVTAPADAGSDPTDMIDVDIDLGMEETLPYTPSALDRAKSEEPGVEDDLPEVEILEDFIEPESAPDTAPQVEAASEPEVSQEDAETAKTPPAEEEKEEEMEAEPSPAPPAEKPDTFGASGDLLGSSQLEEELFSDTWVETEAESAPKVELEPPAEEKPAPSSKGSSAMEALLSRVGIGAKPTPKPAPLAKKDAEVEEEIEEEVKEEVEEEIEEEIEEEVEEEEEEVAFPAAEPELPDMDEPGLQNDVQRLLDQLEAAEEDQEPPQMMKASHLIAALIRLLLKKDVLTQEELLEELKKR